MFSRHEDMFVQHNDPRITYFPASMALDADHCPEKPECRDHWWIQKSQETFPDSTNTEHATQGSSNTTKLEVHFTGTKKLDIYGTCDGDGVGILINNNRSMVEWGSKGGIFASAERLNTSHRYNLTILYGGHQTLAIAGFGVDHDASVLPGNATSSSVETQPSSATHASTRTSLFSAASTVSPGLASHIGSTGQGPSEHLSAANPISRPALAGIIVGSVVFVVAALAMAWFIRKRILARRAPSYAFRRHGVAEAHWTQRPTSPAVPRSADWETYTIPTTDEVLRSPLLERTPSVSETHSKVGIKPYHYPYP